MLAKRGGDQMGCSFGREAHDIVPHLVYNAFAGTFI
jgi:hypothetical protein